MYKLTLEREVPGRFIKNIRGTLVLFIDGEATVTKAVAEKAKAYRYIKVEAVTEEIEAVEQTEVVAPTVDPVVVEEASEEEASEQEATEGEEASYTKEQIEALYEELGTWTAVAESLEVTVAKLRDIRKDVGLA